jgi:antitoxin component YwqK of YwqJK toxin-antitoxin module
VKNSAFLAVCLAGSTALYAQGVTRKTYHDPDKKNLKEVYQVTDTIRNILDGRYISYYLNGNVESKGQFTNNETSGEWEFFYETGKLKMRGLLKQNTNFGLWEYFYESGQISMKGNVNGKNREGEWTTFYENGQVKEVGEYKKNKREGLWKAYFEDGVLKGEIDYTDDFGRFTEYYHSGKVYGEGPKTNSYNVGNWRFFGEDGVLQSEGEYANGKKNGDWKSYYSDGKISSAGKYIHDQPSGYWEYFYADGKPSQSGSFDNGVRNGQWKSFYADGSQNSETVFNNGTGELREYYSSGKLKTKGKTVNDKREGRWEYFYETGEKEGACEFQNGKGTYYGYFRNGNLQTKGLMDNDLKTGTWEIYEADGQLSGYYRPFYDHNNKGKEIVALAGNIPYVKKLGKRNKKLTNFDPRFNEFQGLIVGGNPLMIFAGRIPLGVEYYLQERLGHEFEFIGIRDRFFKSDLLVPAGEKFERGYGICIKQKLYNHVKTGLWYFGHEIRFTNLGHFINEPISPMSSEIFTLSAVEQRIEWGLLLGYRIARSTCGEGITIDTFISGDIGYRGFDVDPKFAAYFVDINQSKLSTSFHLGLNFGNIFSFR